MSYTIGAVDRALALLEVLAQHPNARVSELASLTGNTKSLVFRLIYTLEQRGYVVKDPATRTYTLGYQSIFLGAQAQRQVVLLQVAAPVMDDLASRCHENINLLVREGRNSVCVALRESPLPLRLYAQVGRRGPLHVGGGPKVLLAFAPQEVQDEVLAGPLSVHTPKTITDPAQLAALIDTIRRSGINESHGDLDPDSFSFAAPVFVHDGTVVAALSIAGPASRLTDELTNSYRWLVRDGANRISQALGFQPKLLAAV
jgi:IclR family transcriptional regulator, KDG regulon repressor